ncbi:hypothetical protein sscle_04g032320 [Sclerotinia sclerotiorum 1980 UF-70]|uniref:Ankyrin repeat protein n=1 Tax=Sclerotinia sclerotiorum (strain ATCC 18683 / 1980 / Ss-1) TaxID=665079 RepID=A0A1D9Q0X3_SCLS1|nr:hypothetical protein sscle_04g032320 [Sclerotinia sclerotiorum 1980 UF-70]
MVEAASAGNLDMLEQLLADEENPAEETIQTLLNAAAWKSQTSIVSFLLSNYPSVPLPEETIRAAVYSPSIELISALLSKAAAIINHQFDRRGANPNQDPDTAPPPLVSVAAFYNDIRAADVLLKHGAKLEDSGAIEMAVDRRNEIMVRYFKERGMKSEKVEG